jgi:deazaflavin-dependent oxidoreductase (nitroreductase family)
MKMPSPVRYFNKYLLNRLTIQLARSSFGPFAIIIHVGRRSGKTYETPIIVQSIPGGFVLALTYGREVDWVKNVLDAGHCKIVLHRKEFLMQKIEPMGREAALPTFPWLERLILQGIGIEHYLRMEF